MGMSISYCKYLDAYNDALFDFVSDEYHKWSQITNPSNPFWKSFFTTCYEMMMNGKDLTEKQREILEREMEINKVKIPQLNQFEFKITLPVYLEAQGSVFNRQEEFGTFLQWLQLQEKRHGPIYQISFKMGTHVSTYHTLRSTIRDDCYYGVLDKFKHEYPQAHFEIITRKDGHILSPSDSLLWKAKGGWPFEKYREGFLKEMDGPTQKQKMDELIEISHTKLVFLVCYEIKPSECHRSIVKELMENRIKTGDYKFE